MKKNLKDNKKQELIAVKPSTKQNLDDLKIHPRQSYDEVIQELIERRVINEKNKG